VHNNPLLPLSASVGRLPKKIDNGPFLIGYLAGTRSSGFLRLTSLACSACPHLLGTSSRESAQVDPIDAQSYVFGTTEGTHLGKVYVTRRSCCCGASDDMRIAITLTRHSTCTCAHRLPMVQAGLTGLCPFERCYAQRGRCHHALLERAWMHAPIVTPHPIYAVPYTI
jgi:hypothetical protein